MNLHNQIMNIPTDLMDPYIRNESAYKLGHRDARHAAAELSLKYQKYIEKLEELAHELNDSLISGIVDLPGIRKEYNL